MIINLKDAGLWLLHINPESGNEDTLTKIKKGFLLKDVERVVNLCRKYGILTFANFIIGFPWEGDKEISITHDFALKLNADFALFIKLTIFPMTQLYSDYRGLLHVSPFKDRSLFGSQTSTPNLQGLSPEKIDKWIVK